MQRKSFMKMNRMMYCQGSAYIQWNCVF